MTVIVDTPLGRVVFDTPNGSGEFSDVGRAIAVDGEGNIYVNDENLHRVVKFDPSLVTDNRYWADNTMGNAYVSLEGETDADE